MPPHRESTGAGPSQGRSKLTPERRRELHGAVLDLLREGGYPALTMEAVAARTRCSKSTLYRRWHTKQGLLAAALRTFRNVRLADIDTGSLAGDLRAAARVIGGPDGKDTALVDALVPAVLQDAKLRQALRDEVVAPELAALEEMVHRAVARGEVAADNPAAEFTTALLVGAMRARPLVHGEQADEAYLLRCVDSVALPSLGLAPVGTPTNPPPTPAPPPTPRCTLPL